MRITSIAFVLVTLVVAGCGGGNSEPAENPDQTASAPMAGDKLVGVWFGIAVLDDNKFDRKLESMVDENDKQQLRTRASTFQSTLIGAHFKPDGSLELDVEIMGVDGQKYRESVAGTWRVVEQTATEVIVETAEHRPDGEVGKKSRVHYRFVEDDDHMATIAPAAKDLADCNPLFLFERQDFSDTSEARAPNGAIR